MNERCLRLLNDLSLALEEDPRLLAVKKDEEAMLSSPVSAPLHEVLMKKRELYLRTRLEMGEKAAETEQAQRELAQAKEALDLTEEGKAYRHSYAAVASLYRDLDAILFKPYREEASCKESHAAR